MAKKYSTDPLWRKIKEASNEWGFANDWAVVISYYNFYHGKHVQVFAKDKDHKAVYRIIAMLDNQTVLALDNQQSIHYLAPADVLSWQKQFSYNEAEPTPKTIKLTGSKTWNQINEVYYYE